MKTIGIVLIWSLWGAATAYTAPSCSDSKNNVDKCLSATTPQSRKAFFRTLLTTSSTVASTVLVQNINGISAANAFDGSGSSAYAGRTPASKAELKKSYQSRVVADVKDFKALGDAIQSKGETGGEAWVNFFIEYQRREPDSVGRTYAALVDLVGGEMSGCGILLATSYAKSGKPADNLPSVKKYNSMAKLFEPIKTAGTKGDAAKAKAAWIKASVALSEYLESVELPSSLSDPLYD